MGELQAGARIDLDDTARELGMSRTPVREACLELTHDGLIQMAPRSGIVVIGIEPQDLLDNFRIMTVLSSIAVRWASERADETQIAEIEKLRDNVLAAIQDNGDIAGSNWRFHRAINLASGSRRVMNLLGQTGRLLPLNLFRIFPSQIPCTISDHDDLASAIANRQPDTAEDVMKRHFDHAYGLLQQHFAQE